MKVLFDLLTIRYADNSGIAVYATRVLDGWHASGIKDVTILVNQFWADSFKDRWPSYERIVVNVLNSGYSRRGLKVGIKRKLAIDASGCDVIFYPMPEPWFFETPSIPQVTVIHDTLAPKIAKGKHWFYHHTMLPYQIWRSKSIIAISEYTCNEAIKEYSFLKPDRITVVSNPLVWQEKRYSPLVDYPYILCVNTIAPYKNGLTLAKAFARIQSKTDCKLLFVGIVWGDYWSEIEKVARDNRFSDRLAHMENLSEDDLVALYQHARLFVSPSTMEGFGQTPIEAAIYGCPVITSRMAALPESTLGLLRYYEPVTDDAALAREMGYILSNPPATSELKEISERLKDAYDNCKQSLKIYDAIVQSVDLGR